MNFTLLFSALFWGCQNEETEHYSPNNLVEVSIKSNSTVTSRTSINDDESNNDFLSIKWDSDDQIAVWAKSSSSSSYAIEGTTFTLRYFGSSSYSDAEFTATIPQMESGEYTYYATYPIPNYISGTQAAYTIDAVQSGEYNGAYDIMVSEAVTMNELSSSAIGMPSLSFTHLMHMIRIEVPDGRNYFDADLTGMEITFPQDVVGDVVYDVVSDDAEITVESGSSSNFITLEFNESFTTGDGQYIWVFVAPQTLDGELSFVALGPNGARSQSISTTINKTMEAGKITPFKLSLLDVMVTTGLSIEIPNTDVETKIGEPLSSVTFTLPDGVYFADGTSEIIMSRQSDGIYNLYLYNISGDEISALNNGSLGIKLDTESVEKEVTLDIDGVTEGETISIGTVDVPYFFNTTFSEITGTSSGSSTAIPGLTGWVSTARGGWVSGGYVYVNATNSTFSSSISQGRMNSCTLATWGLKSEANSVSLNVSYDATWIDDNLDNMSINMGYGTSTSIGGTINSAIPSTCTADTAVSAGGTISGASSSDRICWESVGSSAGWLSSGTDQVRIDNVTITIAPATN
ncbi:MAG: hypothetical protein SNG10_05375 [Rikenellaceae bacterium]